MDRSTRFWFTDLFRFSAYSDMAIGLGLLFGLQLPINFNSPYKATGIIDFWRGGNTLSEFLGIICTSHLEEIEVVL